MTSLAEARRYALSLPESVESPHFRATSFRVRGMIFATSPDEAQDVVTGLLRQAWRAKAPKGLHSE